MTEETVGVVFLGLAERAASVQEGPFQKLNLLGLKQTILALIFPLPLSGFKWVFAFRFGAHGSRNREANLRIKSVLNEEVGWIKVQMALADVETERPNETRHMLVSVGSDPTGASTDCWVVMPITIERDVITVTKPGAYSVSLLQPDGTEQFVGAFHVLSVDAAPLDAERIAAIRSDPQASKAVRFVVGCKKCPSELKAWAGLDRRPDEDGFIWYADLPDEFVCKCGSTIVNAKPIKRNLIALLGQHVTPNSKEVNFIPLYEQSTLQELRANFRQVLALDPIEEVLQKFIQDNPLLLHQFPAQLIFFKPSILTFFKADFAVLTPQAELVFIEIESGNTRLMTKNGDEAAPLAHAMGQVRNWLHVVDEHRLAVLQCLGIERVSAVRGVVIAGRDSGYSSEHLRRLKGTDRGRITFLTFDDLAANLASLADSIGKL